MKDLTLLFAGTLPDNTRYKIYQKDGTEIYEVETIRSYYGYGRVVASLGLTAKQLYAKA